MNCKQALQLLYSVIDKEADEIDIQEVEKHLKNCRHCMAQYEFERMFKAFVVEKGRNIGENAEFKHKLCAQLDAIDAAGEVGASRAPFRWIPVVMASAAALVLCVLASFWVGDYYRYRTEIVPFIDAFTAHANNIKHGDYGTDPYDYLEELTGIRLGNSHLPLESIKSVSLDTIKGIEFGHLEISDPHNEKSTVSLFVTSAAKYKLPAEPSEKINGHQMLVHRCEECNVIGQLRDDLIFMIIGRPCCRPEQLAELADSF